jgi:hypothetical protein
MKIEHLQERITDYQDSIRVVAKKKLQWTKTTKALIINTLKKVAKQYDIGWRVQELSWMNVNEAINITFDSFPPALLEETNKCPSYQFIPGGALVFTQGYSGDVYVFISLPIIDSLPFADNTIDLNFYSPEKITEKLIVEKVDEFLKEMIAWEVPTVEKQRLGFKNGTNI